MKSTSASVTEGLKCAPELAEKVATATPTWVGVRVKTRVGFG